MTHTHTLPLSKQATLPRFGVAPRRVLVHLSLIGYLLLAMLPVLKGEEAAP